MYHELRSMYASGFLILGLLTVGCGRSAPETGRPGVENARPEDHAATTIGFRIGAGSTSEGDSLLHRTRDSLAEVTVDLTLAEKRHETLSREIAALEQRRQQLRPIVSTTPVPAAAVDRTAPGRRAQTIHQPHPASSAAHSSFGAANTSRAAWQDHDVALPMQARIRQQNPMHSVSTTSAATGWSPAPRTSFAQTEAVQRMPAGAVVIPLEHGVLIGIPEATVPQPDHPNPRSGMSGHVRAR